MAYYVCKMLTSFNGSSEGIYCCYGELSLGKNEDNRINLKRNDDSFMYKTKPW